LPIPYLNCAQATVPAVATFPVGSFPDSIAFDGANMWVTNAANGTLSKLRASDGANLGNFVVGSEPRFVTFDGVNIWVANFNSQSITKLRAFDGANLGNFPLSSNQAVMFNSNRSKIFQLKISTY